MSLTATPHVYLSSAFSWTRLSYVSHSHASRLSFTATKYPAPAQLDTMDSVSCTKPSPVHLSSESSPTLAAFFAAMAAF